jgi:hypothetical protein
MRARVWLAVAISARLRSRPRASPAALDPSTNPDDHDWGIRVWVICADA